MFVMLNIEQKGKDAIIQMTHANVPDRKADAMRKG